jgi:hypothetical protein
MMCSYSEEGSLPADGCTVCLVRMRGPQLLTTTGADVYTPDRNGTALRGARQRTQGIRR